MAQTIPKRHQLAGQGAALSAAILMSTNGLFIKLIPWHPMAIISLRSFLALAFLLVLRLIFPPSRGVKNPPLPMLAGSICFTLTMITFVIANRMTTSANVILLQYGAPAWAALLGWYLVKEKPHWEQWAALVLVIAGLTFFFKDSLGQGSIAGDCLAVISGIFFAGQSVFLRMIKNGNTQDTMIIAHTLSAIIGLPFVFIYPPSLSVSTILSISYMGFFQIGLASLLFAYGIKRIRAVQAMLMAVAEPILNPIWVLAITGEKPSLTALGGGAVILSAVLFSTLIGMRREERKGESLTVEKVP